MNKIFTLTLLLCVSISINSQTNSGKTIVPDSVFYSLAKTPPMGWNTWNKFGCKIDENIIMNMADALVSTGMKDAGYEYLVIDDCWQVSRDENGNVIADPNHFPHGIKYVADYVHSKGLKFGIYSCAGSKTCQGRPGGRGYQFQDARQYAAWGVDYLKYDWCYSEEQNGKAAYKTMCDALKACGRPIVFSICEWGTNKPWLWGQGIGHLWRTTEDINDFFKGELDWGGLGVVDIIERNAPLYKYAGPGHWNDPDMLEIGNGGMTETEYTSHMSMWCMMAAPLMAGNDLTKMDEKTKNILLNKEVIAIDQDVKGIQGHPYVTFDNNKQIWIKPLQNGDIAVCFFNKGESAWTLDYDWKDCRIDHKTVYTIRDLWKHKDTGTTDSKLKSIVAPHGVIMLRLKK
jgi:alpha-galactosidase